MSVDQILHRLRKVGNKVYGFITAQVCLSDLGSSYWHKPTDEMQNYDYYSADNCGKISYNVIDPR